MNAIVSALREVWGLFVEDASFTLGLVISVAVAIYAIPRVIADPAWRGPLFFVILALVLIENVRRTARKSR